MKQKTIQNRQTSRAARSGGGKNSKYAQKIAAQKRGIFSRNSPFTSIDGSSGISLAEVDRIRFKKS